MNPFAEMISGEKNPDFVSPNTTKKKLLLQEEAKRLSGLGLERSEAEKLRVSKGESIGNTTDNSQKDVVNAIRNLRNKGDNHSNNDSNHDVDDLDAIVLSSALDNTSIFNKVSTAGTSQVRRSGEKDGLGRRTLRENVGQKDVDKDATSENTTNAPEGSNPFGALL